MSNQRMLDEENPEKTNKRWPSSIIFIMLNELGERFSFYGLKAILAVYFTQFLLYDEDTSTFAIHLFTFGAYATALVGGWLSDSFLGKFKTILGGSVVYCIGAILLSVTAIPGVTGVIDGRPGAWGAIISLSLIGIGTGGIKACVSTFVGDQFIDNPQALDAVYSLFYFMINTGSLVSTFITPLLAKASYSIAFAVPAGLLCIATIIFLVGSPLYVIIPPGENLLFKSFGIIFTAFREKKSGQEIGNKKAKTFLDYAKPKYGDILVDDLKQVLRVLLVFIPLPVFWALFDQHASRWVFQAQRMDLTIFGNYTLESSQVQILNPGLMLCLIPVFNKIVYPLWAKCVSDITPLYHKMGTGMFLTSLSFIASAALEFFIDASAPNSIPIYFIIPQFFILSCGEIMVSITGLEFAYKQAPASMKSLVMAFWLLAVAIGNALVAVIAIVVNMPSNVINFLVYAALMAVFMVIFLLMNRNYKYTYKAEYEYEVVD